MPDQELTPAEFGRAFRAFMDTMLAAAVPQRSPLQERIALRLGVDVVQLPVVTEELDNFEHPNLQVALDAYAAQADRSVELVGLGLTTNRAEMLESALAARPGRIDLVVELPFLDAEGRRRLIELYARGLDLSAVNVARVAEWTEGASPAYIKELLAPSFL